MRLFPGEAAKPFTKLDAFGRPVRLEDYKGQMLLLVFYRNSACAMCNLHLHYLIEWYKNHHQALKIVAVFESPAENVLNNYSGQHDAPFPLIPDPQGELYDLYGLEISESKVMASLSRAEVQQNIEAAAQLGLSLTQEARSNFHRLTAEFLIGPDQTVCLAHYADYVSDHLPFEEIERHFSKPTHQTLQKQLT